MTLSKDHLYQIASDSLNRKYEEIRKGVLSANPDLVSLDILRNVDEVTVIFGLQRGGDRFDFRLLGNKHDYYRLSMGVRIEETLASLAQADPNVQATGVAARGESLALAFRYTGPVAKAPVAAAPASEAVALALKLAEQNETHAVSYATEAGLFQAADVPAVVCGPGDIAEAHTADEWIAVADLERCLAFLARLADWAET